MVNALPVIDANAHVIETERTWDYLEPSEQKFRPRLFYSPEDETRQYWAMDDKIRGFRFPTLFERELRDFSDRAGRNFATPQVARELDDVDLRLKHMDELGIDIQALHNTFWIERVTTRPEAEVALCRSWNPCGEPGVSGKTPRRVQPVCHVPDQRRCSLHPPLRRRESARDRHRLRSHRSVERGDGAERVQAHGRHRLRRQRKNPLAQRKGAIRALSWTIRAAQIRRCNRPGGQLLGVGLVSRLRLTLAGFKPSTEVT
jgi:hypothetical protein